MGETQTAGLAEITQRFTSQIADIIQRFTSQIADINQQVNSQIPTTGVKNPKRKAAGTAGKAIAETQTDAQIAVALIAEIAQRLISQIADITQQVNSQIPTTGVKNPKRKAADTAGKAIAEKRRKVC